MKDEVLRQEVTELRVKLDAIMRYFGVTFKPYNPGLTPEIRLLCKECGK